MAAQIKSNPSITKMISPRGKANEKMLKSNKDLAKVIATKKDLYFLFGGLTWIRQGCSGCGAQVLLMPLDWYWHEHVAFQSVSVRAADW